MAGLLSPFFGVAPLQPPPFQCFSFFLHPHLPSSPLPPLTLSSFSKVLTAISLLSLFYFLHTFVLYRFLTLFILY